MRRLSILLLCSLPSLGFAVDCTTSTLVTNLVPNGGSFACDTLTIDSDFNFPPDDNAAPLIITVTNDVFINADININGANGIHITTDPSPFIKGGPGASEGGDIQAGAGIGGYESSTLSSDTPDGQAPADDPVCDNGGSGGGGFEAKGEDGGVCLAGSTLAALGGDISGFPSPLRGGFGGGAGAATPVAPNWDLGSGGGGGGALHIISTNGVITVKNGVRISARGGRGGNSTLLGGAGGGGGGGFIILESNFPIINKGIFDTRGGDGGVNISTSTPKGANGGRGAHGAFRTIVSGTVVADRAGLSSFSSSSAALKSDISCGTISQKDEDRNFLKNIIAGFLLAIAVIKILSRFPRRA